MKNSRINPPLLADALIGVVDDIRRDIHGALGTRPWDVAIVTRRWSGDIRGEGTPSITILELDPAPNVKRNSRDRLGPGGREAAGSMVLTGVSLRYTEEELQPKADARTEIAYRLTEKHGQRLKVRWFMLSATPIPRRGDNEGDGTDWYLVLNEVSNLGNFDGVDSP